MVWNRVWFLREVREFMNICIVSTSNEMERKKLNWTLGILFLLLLLLLLLLFVCYYYFFFFLLLINLRNNYFLEARSENGCKK